MPLPFPIAAETEDCSSSCSIRSLLPDDLQELSANIPHLMHYLHQVPIKDMGVPEYYEECDRKLSDIDQKNLIYRVADNLFVHVFADPEDARDFYISIEPAMLEDIRSILESMEQRLLDYVEDLAAAETEEEKEEVLVRAVEENTVVTDGDGGKSKAGSSKKGGGLLSFFRSPRRRRAVPSRSRNPNRLLSSTF